jgi:hypothetical protein
MQVLWERLRAEIELGKQRKADDSEWNGGDGKGRNQKTSDLVSLFHLSWEARIGQIDRSP